MKKSSYQSKSSSFMRFMSFMFIMCTLKLLTSVALAN